jgi:uncharacterized iron-regulated protein
MATMLAAATTAAKGPGNSAVLRVADRTTIPFARMVQEITDAHAIFIGELHESAEHHRIQLEVIRSLHASGVPLALGLEMFRAENQVGLDQWIDGSLDEHAFRRLYEGNWTLPWQLYRDIFLFARENRIPLVGLNVAEGVTRKVARSGFSSLTPEELRKLPPGISCSVDNTYEDFIRRSHGLPAHGGRSFRFFCEAQMLWDAAMAKHLAEYLARNPTRMAVVLAGSAHAWRRGIPAQLRQTAPSLRSTVVVPLLDHKITKDSVTTADADYVVLWPSS